MKASLFISICLLMACFPVLDSSGRGPGSNNRTLQLTIQHTLGGEPLVLGMQSKNFFGEELVVEKFKYYVSNFSVTDLSGKTFPLAASYYLVDEADASSKTITLGIPDIPIQSIHFLLGVDSIRNVSGIQTGALDPLNGMFWTWNSGYIMAKLEGISKAAVTQGHHFTYHIGGFKKSMNTVSTISISLPLEKQRSRVLSLSAEINQWFKSASAIKISETPVCHSPGPLAVRIAANYANMFSLNPSR